MIQAPLTARERRLIAFVQRNPDCSIKTIATYLGAATATVKAMLLGDGSLGKRGYTAVYWSGGGAGSKALNYRGKSSVRVTRYARETLDIDTADVPRISEKAGSYFCGDRF